jgi:hypothetical protein
MLAIFRCKSRQSTKLTGLHFEIAQVPGGLYGGGHPLPDCAMQETL